MQYSIKLFFHAVESAMDTDDLMKLIDKLSSPNSRILNQTGGCYLCKNNRLNRQIDRIDGQPTRFAAHITFQFHQDGDLVLAGFCDKHKLRFESLKKQGWIEINQKDITVIEVMML